MDFLAVLLFASVGFAAGVAGAIFIAQSRIRQAETKAVSAIREQMRVTDHLQKREADMEASRGAWSKAIAECDSLRQKLEEAAEKNRQLEAQLATRLVQQAEAQEPPAPELETTTPAEPVAAAEPQPEPAPVAELALPAEPEPRQGVATTTVTAAGAALALEPAAVEPQPEPILPEPAVASDPQAVLALEPAVDPPEAEPILPTSAVAALQAALIVQSAVIESDARPISPPPALAPETEWALEPAAQPEAELIAAPEAEAEPEPLAAVPATNGRTLANPKICSFCGSIRTVELAHLNGNGDQDPVNLIWSCHTCKTRLDALLKRVNFTRRSRPLRPGGARNWREWSQAVSSVTADNPHEDVKNAIEIIRATPVEKRMEYIASHLRRRRPAIPATIDMTVDSSGVASQS